MKYILASKSPRRREILEMLGVKFEVITSEADESSDITDPYKLVEELSLRKGIAVRDALLAEGAKVAAYDPEAMEACRGIYGGDIAWGEDMYDTATDADAVVLITEWKQFRMPSWRVLRRIMRGNAIIDGRNIYDRAEVEEQGFVYKAIGK